MSFNSVNNNHNIDAAAYRRQIQEEMAKYTDDELIDIFAVNAAEILSNKAEYDVPENGKFRTSEIIFEIPGTQNQGHYFIEFDVLEPKESRRFSIGASRKGSDRLTSIQLKKGTKKEILSFLRDENNSQQFKDALREVSRSCDDYFSSY